METIEVIELVGTLPDVGSHSDTLGFKEEGPW